MIREARIDDRKRVIEFTRGTFSWGDYIERVFDKWLTDKSGRLLVAEFDGKAVGLSFVRFTKKGEAWLQGGRVDKNYRDRGIGKAMMKECLRVAREEMHANVARLIVDKKNLVAHNVCESQGFRKACEFIELERKAERIKDNPLLRDVEYADGRSVSKAWQFTRNSRIFQISGGLYTIRFVWYSLDKQDFERFSSQQRVLVYKPDEEIHGVMLFEESGTEAEIERSIQSCYLDSEHAAGIQALSLFLVNHAADKGLENVKVWTYSDKGIIKSLRQVGFTCEEDESTEMLYEKRL